MPRVGGLVDQQAWWRLSFVASVAACGIDVDEVRRKEFEDKRSGATAGFDLSSWRSLQFSHHYFSSRLRRPTHLQSPA